MRFVCDSCRAQYMISDDKVGAKGVKVRCKKCGYVILVRRADAAAAAPAPAPAASAPAPGGDAGDPGDSADSGGSGGADASGGDSNDSPIPGDDNAPAPQAAAASNGATSSNGTNGHAKNGPFGDAGGLSGLGDDEIGAVFDQVLSSGPHKIDQKPAINPLTAPPEKEDLNLGLDDDLASTRAISNDALKKLAQEAEAFATGAGPGGKKNGTVHNDWYVAVDDQQQGPLSLDKVRDLWDRGEIGPDSLCWRAGMADWIPLTEVEELASELAPKPQKPVVAPAATSQVGTILNVPVETSINVGGVSRTVRSDAPISFGGGLGGGLGGGMAASGSSVGSGGSAADSGGWKPSAASALAALVSEEMSALNTKPKARTSSLLESGPNDLPADLPKAAKTPGLLDIPSGPHDISSPNGRTNNGLYGDTGGHSSMQMPGDAQVRSPNAPYAGPASYGQQAYPQYTPVPPSAPHGMSTALKAGLGVATLLVVGLVAVIVYLVTRPSAPALPPAATVAAAQPPAAAKPLEMPPPPSGMTATPPPATTGTPAMAPPATAAAPTTPAASDAKPPPTPVAPAVATGDAKPPPAPASSGSSSTRPPSRKTSGTSSASGDGDVISAPPPKPVAKSGKGDAFEDMFGEEEDEKPAATTKPKSTRGGYIPPPPGGADVKESLQQSDIMSVVLAHKSDILKCVQEQKAKDPGTTGTLVVRWTIQTSGKPIGVSAQTAQFKSSAMATCITAQIKTWRFPQHRVQGDPIDFPFKF